MRNPRRISMLRPLLFGVLTGMVCVSAASAHITLQTREAPIGSSYKAVLRVPHGCDGSATTAIRVRIPDGFVGVKPMPKPGWRIGIINGAYAKPFTLHHAKVTKGVMEVSWSGGKLPDAFYDEFVLVGTIADELQPGGKLYFKVVQECEKGVHRWIEVPTGGAQGQGSGSEESEPAPALKLLPKR
jgi:uncharacterized protein YcnI